MARQAQQDDLQAHLHEQVRFGIHDAIAADMCPMLQATDYAPSEANECSQQHNGKKHGGHVLT
ncbi:hypothetical protein D3C80_1603530 [compost metagenome]